MMGGSERFHIELQELLDVWSPGSGLTWDEEERDILARECLCCGEVGHYQRKLEEHLSMQGLDQGICLGNDGRVWDGHHRIVAARRLGISRIPLESAEDATDRWVRDHGYVGWEERSFGDAVTTEDSQVR